MAASKRLVGIIVGGGPAPGINGVISAATIEARNTGWEVIGFLDGYKHLVGPNPEVMPLDISDVSRIHNRGGSLLRTSRTNPGKDPEKLKQVVDHLLRIGVTDLISIGGDDTAFTASRVSAVAREERRADFRVVHVPKTIDNDLPLPEGTPTFGYETARQVGSVIVQNLAEDARSIGRWFLVVAMGRKAGHLALGIGKASGATVILIPEEFDSAVRLDTVADLVVTSILKRLAGGRNYGVAVLAEGLLEKMDPADLQHLDEVPRDEFGHMLLSEVKFGAIVKHRVEQRLAEMGIKLRMIDHVVGYEVRCAHPVAFDIEYSRHLGYAAVELLKQGRSNVLVSIQGNFITPIAFDQIIDPATGKMGVRMVNISSIHYRIARKYMIRLERTDLEDPEKLGKLAALAKMTPESFRQRFEPLTRLASS
ncbi:6-phosphofructokinase [bacterium]|nr:6-phosphofructokinase [bacterium]